jgi:hypothetical protein
VNDMASAKKFKPVKNYNKSISGYVEWVKDKICEQITGEVIDA